MRPKIPSETQNTSKDHLFSIEISRNVERQKTLVFDLDFEKNVLMPTRDDEGEVARRPGWLLWLCDLGALLYKFHFFYLHVTAQP